MGIIYNEITWVSLHGVTQKGQRDKEVRDVGFVVELQRDMLESLFRGPTRQLPCILSLVFSNALFIYYSNLVLDFTNDSIMIKKFYTNSPLSFISFKRALTKIVSFFFQHLTLRLDEAKNLRPFFIFNVYLDTYYRSCFSLHCLSQKFEPLTFSSQCKLLTIERSVFFNLYCVILFVHLSCPSIFYISFV